jgi:hypothetical protein
MRWKATESKCSDAIIWIVRVPNTDWAYNPFETEFAARAFADEQNELRAEQRRARKTAEAERLAKEKAATDESEAA